MSKRAGLVAAIVLALAAAAPAAAAPAAPAPWVRVRSPHFVVSGNARVADVKAVATGLEQFREILRRVFPGTRLATRPLRVVAFGDRKSFEPFLPRSNGRPAEGVGGYFTSWGDSTCIALRLDLPDDAYRVVFHEYTHLFLKEEVPGLPPWLDEGLAEYYSTARIVEGGRGALVARPIAWHAAILAERFIPLAELLQVTKTAALWNDPVSLAVFYAESWALVHYLSMDEVLGPRFAAFVNHSARGRGSIEAFEQAFGPVAGVESALKAYLRRPKPHWNLAFADRVDADRFPARAMSDGEVEASLAALLAHLQRFDEASARLSRALEAAPRLSEAHTILGMMQLYRGRPAEARQILRSAVAEDPGSLDAAYYWGEALLDDVRKSSARDLEQARGAVAALIPPGDPPADGLALLGMLQLETGQPAEAERSLRRSVELAPGRVGSVTRLAEVLGRRGKFDEARALLRRLAADAAGTEDGEEIADQVARLDDAEARARLRAEIAAAAGVPAAPDVAEPGGGRAPEFRAVGQQEQRRAGLLERIECGVAGVVMWLRVPGALLRFHAPQFEDIALITYREDLAGSVRCGPRTDPEPVYLTWQALEGETPSSLGQLAGRVVAVEFLPKEYAPRR